MAKKQKHRSRDSDVEWLKLERFVDSIAKGQKPTRLYFLKETFRAAIKLARESPGTLNLKIAASTLKELRYSFQMFYPYRFIPKITMFGSARLAPSNPSYKLAKKFAQEAVKRNYMIITGGGPGVMQAGNEGAGRGASFGLNIRLPMEQSANPFIDQEKKLIHYKYFYTRKLFLIKEASALILFPGGYGTFDEAFELLTLLQTGKTEIIPVVFLEPKSVGFWKKFWAVVGKQLVDHKLISPQDTHLFRICNTSKDALDHIDHFYHNYHSMRMVRDKLAMRIKKPLDKKTMIKLNKKFGFLSKSGKIVQRNAVPEEVNEPELEHLTRLVFPSDKRDFSGLRLLIDFINDSTV